MAPLNNKKKEMLVIGQNLAKTYKVKLFAKTVFVIISILVVFMLGAFGSLYLLNEKGGFTVSIDKVVGQQQSLSLSTDVDFSNPTSNLKFSEPTTLVNESTGEIPETHDEANSSSGYIYFSFYLTNTGTASTDVCVEIRLSDVTQGCDEALRIRVIQDNSFKTYAKIGTNGVPEIGTIPFESDEVAYSEEVLDFAPGDVIHYTVVIWFDGDDKECVNSIRGGQLNIEMHFGTTEEKEEE